MKQFKFIFASALVAAALLFVACNKDDDKDEPVNPSQEASVDPTGEPSQEPALLPEVEGTDGSITLVVKFDQGVCAGYKVKFAGDYKESVEAGGGWGDPNNTFEYAREMQAIEGWPNWYKIVLTPTTEESETINGRPLQVGEQFGWSYDWSHTIENGELVLLQGGGEDIWADSGYGEINLSMAVAYATDAEVIYIECKKWNLQPCVTRLPGGEYTFTVNLAEAAPAGAILYFTGNFPEKAWGESDREMTKVTDTQYTWTGTVPDEFEFKVFYVLDGNQTWAAEGNHALVTEEDLTASFSWPAPAVE